MNKFLQTGSFEQISKHNIGKGKVLTGNDHKEIFKETHLIEESFVAEFGGQLIRRSHEDEHQYFMTLLKNNPIDGWVPLTVKAKSAMFFDPLTGRKGKAAVKEENG